MSREARCLNIQVRNTWLDRNSEWLRLPRFGAGTRAARIATRVARALQTKGDPEVVHWVEELAAATLAPSARSTDPVAAKVKTLFAERYSGPVRLPVLAREVGVHPSHMSRVFVKSFGKTCGQFLGEVRLTHAARLLATTPASIAEIALLCGFFDQSHLTNAFRKNVGISPSQYRGCYTSNWTSSESDGLDFPRH